MSEGFGVDVCVVVRKRRNVLNRCCVDHFLFSFKIYVSLDIYCNIFSVHNILYRIHYTVCFLAYNTSYNVPAYSVHRTLYDVYRHKHRLHDVQCTRDYIIITDIVNVVDL